MEELEWSKVSVKVAEANSGQLARGNFKCNVSENEEIKSSSWKKNENQSHESHSYL